MREVKFRGKEVGTGKWIYGYYVRDEEWAHDYIINLEKDGIYFHLKRHEVSPSTVGQYTEIKDKNKKEIYEDDIIKTRSTHIARIEWDKVSCGFRFIDSHYHTHEECYIRNLSEGMAKHTYEVIGNVHDNPKLLKEVK